MDEHSEEIRSWRIYFAVSFVSLTVATLLVAHFVDKVI